ncbi:ribonuclease H-like domain-containing protein [Tanacetum coccineum]|uniref:Ribonuclease H-like domain-containing protein n=1 Tax=Tanacetum coccineum TaxID=301880 RepID=A0ABQ5ABG9_9ASTR
MSDHDDELQMNTLLFRGNQRQELPCFSLIPVEHVADFPNIWMMQGIYGMQSKLESPSFSSSTTYSAPSSSKARSHSSGNMLQDVLYSLVAKSEPEQQFEKKAGRKIEFDKKEADRFNKKAVRCYKCLQKGHFARECRAKGGNEKRYSSFKIQELGKKEADTKALITYGMVAGCGAACEEGVAKVYSLITGNGTDAAGEFALMGKTSKVQAYKNSLKTLEKQKRVYQQNQLGYEEKIRVLSIELENTTNLLKHSERINVEAKIAKKDLQTKLDNHLVQIKREGPLPGTYSDN